MPAASPILVVGATGLLGSRVCRQLSDRGHRVRAMVRPGSPGVDALQTRGIDTVEGDLKDGVSLDRACRGAWAVVTTANAVVARRPGDSLRTVDLNGHLALIGAARAAGVARFVYTSLSPCAPSNNPFVRGKRQVEAALRASGVPWTILQPAKFMEVHLGPLLGWRLDRGQARLLGSPRTVHSYVSVDDVAAFAVRAVDLPAAAGRTLHITGPEPLCAADALAIAEQVAGRTFTVQRVPHAALVVASGLLRPFSAVLSSMLAMSASRADDIADMAALAAEFEVRLTPLAEYVRARLSQPAGPVPPGA